MQAAGITKGDVLQRMAAISFLVAFVLTMAVNIIFPRASDPTSTKSWIEAWANAGSGFKVLSLLLAAGMWAALIGVVGIYRAHTTGAAAAWTRLGFYGVLIGTVLWTLIGVEQIGTSLVLADWAKATGSDKQTLFLVASSFMQMNTTLFGMVDIVLWLALTFLGIGMILGAIYPKWLSWVLTILGVLTVVAVGIPTTLVGTTSVGSTLFAILAGLTFLWMLVAGIWLLRKAW